MVPRGPPGMVSWNPTEERFPKSERTGSWKPTPFQVFNCIRTPEEQAASTPFQKRSSSNERVDNAQPGMVSSERSDAKRI